MDFFLRRSMDIRNLPWISAYFNLHIQKSSHVALGIHPVFPTSVKVANCAWCLRTPGLHTGTPMTSSRISHRPKEDTLWLCQNMLNMSNQELDCFSWKIQSKMDNKWGYTLVMTNSLLSPMTASKSCVLYIVFPLLA